MAFTKTPTGDTYQTKSVPLMHTWSTRNISNTKDTDNINVLLEPVTNPITQDKYVEILKRDGTLPISLQVVPTSEIYGAYFWKRVYLGTYSPVYVIIGAFGVRMYSPDWQYYAGDNFVFNNQLIGFTEFLYDDGSQALIVTDGFQVKVINAGGTITNPTGWPNPHRSYPVFLDGYVFLADINSGTIYNSNLNDPLTWNSSQNIGAESYPDPIYALGRSGQYVVAFGSQSIQFFYDAANPTGSPLAAQTTTIQVGFLGGLVSYKDELYFLGRPTGGNAGLYKLSGLKVELISEVPYARWSNTLSGNILTFVNGVADLPGFIMLMNGHAVYTLGKLTGTSPQTPDFTYTYDLDTGMWAKMVYQNGTKFDLRTAVSVDFGDKGIRTVITFKGGTVPYEFDRNAYQDNGVNFTCSFVTPPMDFDTRRMKFASRMLLHSDQTPSTSLMQVSWSDDDYQTFTSPRPIDVSKMYPALFACGAFRKRAFKFTYSDNFPMRWESIELDYNQGEW